MELVEDLFPVYYNNLDELTAATMPDGEIVSMSAVTDSVQMAIYQLPPMESVICSFENHTFSIALTDLPSLELSADKVTYRACPMKAGDWIFIPSHQVLYSRWAENSLCMHLYLNPTFVNRVGSLDFLEQPVNFKALIDLQDPTIDRLLELFKQEFAANRLTDILYAESLAKTLTVHLIRRYASNYRRKVFDRRVYLDGLELQKTIDIIEQNLDREMTVQQLAQQAHVSISVFAHSFKKKTGISPHQFILEHRLQKSEKLLLDRDANLSISAIAHTCGFANAGAFATRFRQKYCVSPSQYRVDHH